MSEKVVLGLDTSNYTTSLAILSLDGELIANIKRPLKVKAGERGLRQSDALFAHTVNIPDIMKEGASFLPGKEIVAIGVSEKPRNQEGSYMPCFLAGVASAESIATALGLPLYRFSHQCGHIMAAIYSSGAYDLMDTSFAALHVSGGTTELVRVTGDGGAFKTELLGGTADLNAGQVIDRIGVYLGMPFPCGVYMEEEARKNDKKIPKKKLSVNGMTMNLSGLENMAVKLYNDTKDKALVAAFVFDFIGRSIISVMNSYRETFEEEKFVLAGGVMSNKIIKDMIRAEFDAYFAEPALSADNAVGISVLALRSYLLENKND